MKKTTFAIAMIAFLAIGGQAFGELCAADNVPAASLLFPYFKVAVSTPGDGGACDDPNAATTFIAINNASQGPIVAHVSVFTDWSVGEIDFDIYLTGYDVQTFDVKEIFCGGNLPVTGPGGVLSNLGAFSTTASPFPATPFDICGTHLTPGIPANYINPAIDASFRDHLRAIFTGNASPSTGQCGGSPSVYAQGYIHVDANQDCDLSFPDEAAYWGDTTVVVLTDIANVLWGDYQYIDRNAGTSEGFAAVHLEAGALGQLATSPTFYGRYVAAATPGADNREPLATTWAARYNRTPNAPPGFVGTYFQIWREGAGQTIEKTCNGNPPWDTDPNDNCNGLDQSSSGNSAVAFNEQEDVIITGGPSGQTLPEACIPYETQNLLVGASNPVTGSNLPVPSSFNNGWYYLNLQNGEAIQPAGTIAQPRGQAYLTVTQTLDVGRGQFSGGWEGVALDGQCFVTGVGPFTVTTPVASPTLVNPN